MRFWISGPRLFRGLIRPGISFSARDLKSNKKVVSADGLLGILQRGDGTLSIFAKLQGNEEFTPGDSMPRALASAPRLMHRRFGMAP
jgi:hypothetical protein